MKVTLLGDSIRLIGYGPQVPALLGEGFTVYQPEDNCRFARYTLRLLFDLRDQIAGSDVIHWNNGLWDACELFGDGAFTPIDEYVQTMVRIARLLKAQAREVIFATTTPVDPRNVHDDNDRIRLYNDRVVPALRAEGVRINDLHALVLPHIDTFITTDRLHLSPAGADACAAQVAQAIRDAANALD